MEELFEKANTLIKEIEYLNDEILNTIIRENYTSYSWVSYLVDISKGEAGQRTKEWYNQRNACITASAINGILSNSQYKKEQIILEKCGKSNFFRSKYTDWGNQYEQVAVNIFEELRKVEIFDAPLLIHPIYPYIGASSDGFVLDHNNKEGYLIEIKCPYSRVPNGEIPIHYWEQPQTQMEVCKVDKCVFFDCQFEEINEEDYDLENQVEFKGSMIEVFNKEKDDKEYIYCPFFNKSKDEHKKWMNERFNENNIIFIKFIWWKLVKYCEIEERRNKKWFKENLEHFTRIWNEITEYRKQGLEKLMEDIEKRKIIKFKQSKRSKEGYDYIPPICN